MVLTVRKALPATSEFGTPTPKVFSMLTTSSSASIESRPRPFGPNKGRSLAISSGVVCNIKFFTSICLMRLRRSDSDINAKRDSVLNSGNGQTRIAFDDRLFRQDSRDFWITHPANLVNPVSKPALFDRPAGLSD